MEKDKNWYKKYRWFFTKSGNLVYGGKSAEQNEEVVNSLEQERIVMHTHMPGSPFAVIESPVANVTEQDILEACIWTACFSRAWREGLRKMQVDIFDSKQLYKDKRMEKGTFGVNGDIESKVVILKLCTTKQAGIIRCVPEQTLNKKIQSTLTLFPGKMSKESCATELSKILKVPAENVLNALPTGRFAIKKERLDKKYNE